MDISDVLDILEQKMGLPEGFFENLENEDDWSLVIKVHSFMEALLTDLIIDTIQEPALKTIVSRMEMSNSKNGKIALASALDLIGDNEKFTIRYLSELRNELVHNIYMIKFKFDNYIKNMDDNQKKAFKKCFSTKNTHIIEKEFGIDMIMSNPKNAVWICVVNMAAEIYLKKDRIVFNKFKESLLFYTKVLNSK